MTLADSAANRKAFPKVQMSHDEVGFPMMRMVGLFCLKSAAILTALSGN